MSPTTALCLSTALLLALAPTTTNALHIGVVRSRTTAQRCVLQMMPADDASIRECLVDAENAGEQEACVEDGEVATNSADGALSWAPALAHDRTENLLGPHESLAECLWEAENPGEIAECRVDFEELLGVRATCNLSTIQMTMWCFAHIPLAIRGRYLPASATPRQRCATRRTSAQKSNVKRPPFAPPAQR